MRSFSERDVRRHYDLLQHGRELGLTQLKVLDGTHILGIGLFDTEDDFVAECRRYNGLGVLYVGVNPRSLRLLKDLGGLRNRVRTLFQEVVGESGIDHVTGIVVPGRSALTERANRYCRDTTVLSERALFFPMDEPIPVQDSSRREVQERIAFWLYGDNGRPAPPLTHFTRVVGTMAPDGGWLRRRTRFWRYRPYILDGITAEILKAGA